MIAIISDIHSNLEAFQAVLADIHTRKISDIICLGDLVGYGANPRECIDLAQQSNKVTLRGNHDEAILHDAKDFNLRAEAALVWTREQLYSGGQNTKDRRRRLDFLASLPSVYEDSDLLFVHGSPRIPMRDYVFPRDIRLKGKMDEIFGKIKRYCFCGHTHIPGVFTLNRKYIHPEDLLGGVYILDEDSKALINVGSVGQPRDSDRRACYCTFDGDSLVFRRVQYDAHTTAQKIRETAGLDSSLADRLLAGK